MPLKKAEKPFVFKTELGLVLLTGQKASNVLGLRDHLLTVPESSVYYHTHYFLQQHHFLIPEPPNDFAYWVSNVLREEALGERLAAINTVRFDSLEELRQALAAAMSSFLEKSPPPREAPPGSEFHFMKVVRFNLPMCRAHDLEEFALCLAKASIHSLYYHLFESRLRTSRGVNDFSIWFGELGETALAEQAERLNPYRHTLEELRARLAALVKDRIREETDAPVG